MQLRQAVKLHNGDEVIDKATGESIRVLSKTIELDLMGEGKDGVIIEGVGDQQGYGEWNHRSVQ